MIDLRDLKGSEKQKFREAIEDQAGYDFKDVVENEPTLIPDDEFEDYAQELAEDIGAINRDLNWPLNCINWEEASDELKNDYTEVTVDDVTYWFRAF